MDPRALYVFFLDDKRTVQKHLLNYANQGKITYTIFTTGVFFDWGLRTSFFDIDLKTQEVILYGDEKDKFATTNIDEIGNFVAAALKHPNLSVNKSLHFASFFVSQLDILHSLEKATSKKYTVKAHSTTEESKKQIPELLAKGEDRALQLFILTVIFNGYLVYKTDNDLFPKVKLTTLDQSVESVVKGL